MRRVGRGAVVSVVAAVAMVMLPVTASAQPGSTGPDLGQHVVMCAQDMGFDGQHNPGMHQGFAGWDAAHTC